MKKGEYVSIVGAFIQQPADSFRKSFSCWQCCGVHLLIRKSRRLADTSSVALHVSLSRATLAKGLQEAQQPWLGLRQQQRVLREDDVGAS